MTIARTNGQEVGDAVADTNAERAEQEGRERDHDEQGEERHEHHVQRARDDLLQALFHPIQTDSSEQRREDLGRVVVENERQAEDLDLLCVATQERGRLCDIGQTHEFRGEQRGRNSSANPLVRAQLLRRRGANHDGQEVED